MPKLPRRNDADYIRFPPYYTFKSHPGQRTRGDLISLTWRLALIIGVPSVTVLVVILWIRQFMLSA